MITNTRTFSLCDTCGVDRVVLIAMMVEPPESPNRPMAESLIHSCPECREWWAGVRP